ncbi:MAG: helix-turn-helix transcriptional regulator [Romboutsia sp.]|nr:helix-turn-helix transcriptional regulator [Romboutsia sp.]
MNFEDRFSQWLISENLSQNEIANELKVSKSYISNVVNGRTSPSKRLLSYLSKKSNRDVSWWLYGKGQYNILEGLNVLIDALIETGEIKKDGSISDDARKMLDIMLNKEIKLKLDNKRSY